jgi:hypothetical protein
VTSGRIFTTSIFTIPGSGKFGKNITVNTGVLSNDFNTIYNGKNGNPNYSNNLAANLVSGPVDVATGIPITTPFTFNFDGTFQFRAPRNYLGTVTFAYQPYDFITGEQGTVTTVTLNVTGPIRRLALGADAGGSPRVIVYDKSTNFRIFDFLAYDPSFTGGVRVATADLNGDGTDDIITAPGKGGGPNIRVFDGTTGQLIRDFMAYDPSFTGGLNISAGDTDFDGFEDIIVGADAGGGPHVKVIAINKFIEPVTIQDFMAYELNFSGGVRVSAGDVNGDGTVSVVTTPGFGGGPRIKAFNVSTQGTAFVIRDFFAGDANGGQGANIAIGDFNGDYTDDFAVGTGAGNPSVNIYDGKSLFKFGSFVPGQQPAVKNLQSVTTGPQTGLITSASLNPNSSQFTTPEQSSLVRPASLIPGALAGTQPVTPSSKLTGYTGGARISVVYSNQDDFADLIVVSGPSDFPRMRIFSGKDATTLADLTEFDGTFYGGMWAASHF